MEGVKKWAPNQKISRKGAVRQAHGPERSRRAKPQRPAKKLKEFELAFLCALAPLREAVDFFTASLDDVCGHGRRSFGRTKIIPPRVTQSLCVSKCAVLGFVIDEKPHSF